MYKREKYTGSPGTEEKNGTVIQKEECSILTPQHKGAAQGQGVYQFSLQKGVYTVGCKNDAKTGESESAAPVTSTGKKFLERVAESFGI